MKIYVKTEEEKDDIIRQSEYVHNWAEFDSLNFLNRRVHCLDSEFASSLMHIYMAPDIIIVDPKLA